MKLVRGGRATLYLGALIATSCVSAHLADPSFERGAPARAQALPVLVGTLVDGNNQPLARARTTLNCWSENGVVGGTQIATDSNGRFRIQLPQSFVNASSEKRTVGLVASKTEVAVFDARWAIAPGVHDIGDLLHADVGDPRALVYLSDDRLLSRLELLRHWSSDSMDACLQECARRGGQRVIAHLHRLEREESEGSWSMTNIAVVTALNRASRLSDPLDLVLAGHDESPIPCSVGHLPTIRVAFVNRDPMKRVLRLSINSANHDESLAVHCTAVGAGGRSFSHLRPSHEGMRLGGERYELAPGEEVVVPIELAKYLSIASKGLYSCRLAFRPDGSWDLEEDAKELPRGVLFLYSPSFLLDVGAPMGG